MRNIYYEKTKIGYITIVENNGKITNVYFGKKDDLKDVKVKETDTLRKAFLELNEYLDGKRATFDLELDLSNQGTEFMRDVWNRLKEIPYGKTKSYGEIAKEVNRPKAYRAVGMSNNKNPIPIFIPCHRVIGSNNKLVGYGGGIDIKEFLLKLEKENK